MLPTSDRYKPQAWEKMAAFFSAGLVLSVALFIIVRNKPFADPNLVVLMRTLVSFAVAVTGAVIPGFLNINWSRRGATIRAGGALALFILTFVMTPNVISAKSPVPVAETSVPVAETSSDISDLEDRDHEFLRKGGKPYVYATTHNSGETTIDLFHMVVVMSGYSIFPEDLSNTKLISFTDTVNNLKPGETRRIGGRISIKNSPTWMEDVPEHYGDTKFKYFVDWNDPFRATVYFVSSSELDNCKEEEKCLAKLKEKHPHR